MTKKNSLLTFLILSVFLCTLKAMDNNCSDELKQQLYQALQRCNQNKVLDAIQRGAPPFLDINVDAHHYRINILNFAALWSDHVLLAEIFRRLTPDKAYELMQKRDDSGAAPVASFGEEFFSGYISRDGSHYLRDDKELYPKK